MPSSHTKNLGIERIVTGEQSGTWGDTTNVNWDLVDQASNGIVSVTLAVTGSTGSPNDIAITESTLSDGRNRFIEFVDAGDLGATAYIRITPNDAEKIVHIRNSLSGGQDIIAFQGTYNASNDFVIPNGKDVLLKFSGTGTGATVTDVYEDLQVSGLTVTSATFTSVDIDGGTIDATVIGGSTAADGTFDTLTATAFSGLPVAGLTTAGIVELATVAETNTGTDATRAVTPDGLDGWTGSAQLTTLGTIATGVWNGSVIAEAYLQNQSGTNTGDEVYATTSLSGVVELATQAEVDAGTDPIRAVTPETLAGYAGLNPPSTLAALTDTTITSLTENEILVTNSSLDWRNLTFAEAGVAKLVSPTFTGVVTLPKTVFTAAIKESIDVLSGTAPSLDPDNGTIQRWTLTANSAPTHVLENGEFVTLAIYDGTGNYTVDWDSAVDVWIGGSAPDLDNTAENWIEIWRQNSINYGTYVGASS